jgi:hypothetical protein
MPSYNLHINGYNPNLNEIIDYIRDYYIAYDDYIVHYHFNIDKISHVIVEMRTDELLEDKHVRYLLREHADRAAFAREDAQKFCRDPRRY